MRRNGKSACSDGIESNGTPLGPQGGGSPIANGVGINGVGGASPPRISSPRAVMLKRLQTRAQLHCSRKCCAFLVGCITLLCSVVWLSFHSLDFSLWSSEVQRHPHHGYGLVTDVAPMCEAPLAAEEVSYTLVTQVSVDRLWMMEHHCKRWGHRPVSMAVLTQKTRGSIMKRLAELGCRKEDLTVEVMNARLYSDDDYPVNELRNLALKGVKTSHVVFVDVDFWESEGLWEMLMADNVRNALVEDPQLALVLPAFQLFRQCEYGYLCKEQNIGEMPFTLHELATMIKKGHGQMFDPTNRGGHGSTRYADWFLQHPSSLLEIDCVLSNRYEPFLVFRFCHDLPPFQEQFSGYGKNKMTWMMQLIRSGYRLAQVGGAFLVHYPHFDSKSRRNWNESPEELLEIHADKNGHRYKLSAKDVKVDFSQYKRGLVDEEFVKFRKWLREAIPDQTRIPHCEDAQDDDARLWIDRNKETEDNKADAADAPLEAS